MRFLLWSTMSRLPAVLLLAASTLWAHGGQFRPKSGGPRVPPPPGLPSQPTAPAETGKVTHSWVTWWGYRQFQYLDYRRLQRERRGPVSGSETKKDADAWRDALRERLIPVLRQAIRDDDKEVRTAAAVALGKLEAREAIDDLKRMLEKDTLQEAREAALAGLMYMREPQLRETFAKLVADRAEKLRVRGFALFGIGRLGDDESVRYLQAFFDRKDRQARAMLPTSTGEKKQFRIACLAALVLSEAEGLDEFFLTVARNKRFDEHVRAYALSAVGKRGAAERLPDFVEFLSDRREDEQIRRSAAIAIGVVGQKKDRPAIEALAKAVRVEKDDALRHFCLVALGRIGGDAPVKFLLRYLKGAKNEDREFALIALGLTGDPRASPDLAKALRTEKNAKRRAAAAIAIGLHGDVKLAPDLHEEFNEARDWLLLQSCSLSIGMLGYKPAGERLKEVLVEKKQPALRTAAALAYALLKQHQAVPLFVDLLKGTDNVVTMTALVRVMRYLTSPAAAKPLEEIYGDEKLQRQVRAYALVSLGQLADRADFPLLMSMAFDINYFIRCPPLDEALTIL